MASPINVIIEAVWRGRDDVRAAKRDLAGIDDSARKGGRGLADFATKAGIAVGVITALNVASNKAFDALERGAGLQLTQQRFDNLARSIGSTGEALDDKLGAATAGLISNSRQMALATDLIGLELATTEEQAVRLGRVVTELDQDIGELSLALVNQTTRRFDQLNVSAVGFEERLKAIEEQGLDTQAAFTEAFLQQAEAQIERVGGKSESTAGDIARFNSSMENLKDSAELALVSIVNFSGGFEKLENTAETLNAVSDGIEKLSGVLDGFNIKFGPSSVVTDPAGSFLSKIFPFGTDVLVRAIVETDDFESSLDKLLGTLTGVGQFLGIVSTEQEDLTAAITKTTEATRELVKITDTLLNRQSQERGDGDGGRSGDRPVQPFGTITERIDLFQNFQDDLTAINKAGADERLRIEEQYEARRNAIIEDYGRLRAEEEEDWQRRRARAEAKYRQSVGKATEQATEAEQDARERANKSLRELERDHLQAISDIIRNAQLDLEGAAARLDAAAIARIKQQRDEAIRRENQGYQEQQQAIREQLQEQLQAIRENLAERLTELREYHEQRQKEEEEDREVRLRRLEEAHRRELAELEKNYREQQQDLKDHIRQQRQELTNRYIEERLELTQHWNDREDISASYMRQILDAEEAWWNSRLAIVGGGGADRTGGTGGTDGGAGGGPTTPSRSELLTMLTNLAIEAGYPDNIIQGLLRAMAGWSDERIAKYIERVFGIDVPGYALGTPFVQKTGLALVHRGEEINPPGQRSYDQSRQIVIQEGAIQITAGVGMDEEMLGRVFEKRLESFLGRFT